MVRGGPKIISRCPGFSFMGTGIAIRFSVGATGTMGVAWRSCVDPRQTSNAKSIAFGFPELDGIDLKSEGSWCLSIFLLLTAKHHLTKFPWNATVYYIP